MRITSSIVLATENSILVVPKFWNVFTHNTLGYVVFVTLYSLLLASLVRI